MAYILDAVTSSGAANFMTARAARSTLRVNSLNAPEVRNNDYTHSARPAAEQMWLRNNALGKAFRFREYHCESVTPDEYHYREPLAPRC